MVSIPVVHHGETHTFELQPDATVADLASEIEDVLHIPIDNQKLMVAKLGMLKAPFSDRPIADLENKKITLLGTSSAEIASLKSASEKAAARQAHLASARKNAPKAYSSRRDPLRAQEDSQYTFLTLRPLPNLPRPERSLQFLERLKSDPGIRAAMRAHKFSVGLLTEMDPLSYTESSHEGTTRILGLNRNQGEVIELRLRTDAYDGYRDYKTIRNTLCHELAHNVHGPHDRKFWDLCHRIEREVARADWKSGGHSVGDGEEFYEPASEEIAYDHGGWTGGEFVLGGGGPPSSSRTADASAAGATLSRREIMAKAAEERLKKQRQAPDGDSSGPSGS
ncbi:WLM domain-containing protein [Xylaria bambusicola]|uniref:WLM domain-containing protein n=1 Tax=Xylaria bambusicola TaxID=326684 RepID=UPI002008C5C4|nr:WLM domain-containing protein [Xylaria bambusicola]KAI0506592.1 WLM domain-containing protein [Xylaria bambusicola]